MSTTFRLPGLEIHRVVETTHAIGHAQEFFPNLTAELLDENRAWMQPDALDAEDQIILCFQSFVLRTAHHTILVDSCIGNDKERPRARWNRKTDTDWMTALQAAGVTPEQIDFVLCTHLHVDHVGWNTKLENGRWVPTFPNARYLFSQKEFDYWTAQNAEQPVACFVDSVLPVVAANQAQLVTSDHALDDQVRLLPTPGHTPDHFAVEIGRGRAAAVITGDLLHSPLQARHPHIRMRIDVDPEQAVRTRRGFLERFCDTDTLCCFSHFPAPSIGHVRRWGDGFRCDYVF